MDYFWIVRKISILFLITNFSAFSQIITTIAGNGIGAYTGDGGQATAASFSEPQGVMLDDTGNVYVTDEDDNVIRKINNLGIINTVIGTGLVGFSGDGGPAKLAKLNSPGGTAIDRKGNIYIADTYNHVIRKVDQNGIISTIAGHGTISGYGGDGSAATLAYLNFPEMIAVDKYGVIYIADAANNRIRKIDTSGIITTHAGTGSAGYSGDGAAAIAAKLFYPSGIAIDSVSGNIFIGDMSNHAVRKIDTNGIITTFAGTGVLGYTGDGALATTALLNNPQGVAIDTAGTVYISDGGNNRIRKVDKAGIISAYVGTGQAGYSGDNGPASLAKIYDPPGITTDVAGNLYIAEYFNSRVRKVTFCSVPLSLNISGTTTLCAGDSTTLTASGASSYTWSIGNIDTNAVTVKPTATASYSITGLSGGCIVLDSITVTVNSCSSGVTFMTGSNEILLFPNPANEIINLRTAQGTDYRVYDARGKLLMHAKIKSGTEQMNIADLAKGVYFISVFSENKFLGNIGFVRN